MGFKRFSLYLVLRLGLIALLLAAFVALLIAPGYQVATLVALASAGLATMETHRFISRTNAELNRFLDAARYGDYGQRFNLTALGAGFGELGETFTAILDRFRAERTGQEEELRHHKALIEHVPVPLISVHGDGLVTVWNNAARRLFGSHHPRRISDLAIFGDEFKRQVTVIEPGQRTLAPFNADGAEGQVAIAATQIMIGGRPERIVSLQDIGSELDQAQLEAWQSLVRVLTHEIMNSITPVASLAKTAADLVEDAAAKVTDHPEAVAELEDVLDAVNTVARRSDGLMQFVQSYRRLTRLPPPEKARLSVKMLLEEAARLATHDWEARKIGLLIDVEPTSLEVMADHDMLMQVLINLMQNAAQALAGEGGPKEGAEVTLSARLNRRGRVVVEVADNGPGIPDAIARQVFVPFYTTKRDGSGVGLALTRQVMIAHGGGVSLATREGGGALFTLTF
ncbi:sensor histidine kinase [Gimibacter soli]|uniref:histidine kinase n=1 Tax=Gimibacter soli TaxID=3024400 RepID=A0AAE9XPQ7_9PROT|nr:ATP-binding protein [Gimibacter soli]WCL53992.1 ATP-binding protein [Gimibacter soli]